MISECCGAEDRGDLSFDNLGRCPICEEHCLFISEEEFGERYAKEQEINALTGDE